MPGLNKKFEGLRLTKNLVGGWVFYPRHGQIFTKWFILNQIISIMKVFLSTINEIYYPMVPNQTSNFSWLPLPERALLLAIL